MESITDTRKRSNTIRKSFRNTIGKQKSKFPEPELIQSKLTIGKPNDKYEQEADRITDQVMRMPDPVEKIQHKYAVCEEEAAMQKKPISDSITPWIQTQPLKEEEEELQTKSIQAQPIEEEEEEIMPKLIQTQPIEEEEEPVQTYIQKQLEEEEEHLQAKSEESSIRGNNSWLQTKLDSSKTNGSPLPNHTRSFMETRFGTDFNKVRIHNDSSAAEMNRSIHAQAFTSGNNIYFNDGKYSPDSNSGKKLLAHELAHVVQQNGTNNNWRRSNGKIWQNDKSKSDILHTSPIQIQKWNLQSRSNFKFLEDTTVKAPNGWLYRFRLYETTPDLAKRMAQMRNGFVLQAKSAKKFETLFGLKKENYAPLYKPGRFYTLFHLHRGPYLKIETFIKNLTYIYKEQQRLKKVIPQIKTAEPALNVAFGKYWPTVRKLLVRKGPFKTPLTNMNFKLKVAEPTATVKAKMSSGLKPNLDLIRIKAEKGYNIQRPGAKITIGIDLVNNSISFSIGDIQFDAQGGMDLKYSNQSGCYIGISKEFFNPLSTGITWKIGCEKTGKFITIGSGPYKYQLYIELLAEGDLSTKGRLKYTFFYALGAVGLALLLSKLAAGTVIGHVLKPVPVTP